MTDYILLSDQDLLSLAEKGDSRAEETLLSRYSRTVRACARPLFLMGGDSEDLIQEGMMGLLSAIRQFDTASNVPFKSYAELCINRRLFSSSVPVPNVDRIPGTAGRRCSARDAGTYSTSSTSAFAACVIRRLV